MTGSTARVQIVGRVSGRRHWTVEQKLAIIGEAFAVGSSIAGTTERHEINSGQLYTWRRQLLDGELGGSRKSNLAPQAGLDRHNGLDCQNGLGFARVDLAPACQTAAPQPGVTASSPLSCTAGGWERSETRSGVIEIELRSGVRVRVNDAVDAALLTCVLDALGAR